MSAYYNENDVNAAAWLRELIKAGLIAHGEVDERSIADVAPDDLVGYAQCHFFAGIGGWSYALRLAGWDDEKPVWTGSCPCQPFSDAGKRGGSNDKRHLWPELYRLARECRPPVVFGEQVASPLGRAWLDGVFADLENSDYTCGAADLCAAGVGAPHIRQRLYWVAYTVCERVSESRPHENSASKGIGTSEAWKQRIWPDTGADCGGLANSQLQPRCAKYEPQSGRRSNTSPQHSSEPGGGGAAGGLANTCGRRREQCDTRLGQFQFTDSHGFAGRMGDAERAGLEGQGRDESNGHESRRLDPLTPRPITASGGANFWGDYRLVHCADGKTRRIESTTEPLAHGFPARVAILRGLGNAIVPQVAAEFVQTCEKAVTALPAEAPQP